MLAAVPRPLRLALLSAAMLVVAPDVDAAKIRVRGRANLEARLVPTTDGVEIRGVASDDAGAPLADATVFMRVRGGTLPRSMACPPSPPEHHRGGPDEVGVGTARDGAFCLRLRSESVGGSLDLRIAATSDHDATTTTVPLDPSARGLRIELIPKPSELPLDRPTHDVVVRTRLEPPLAGGIRGPGLVIDLHDERGTKLDSQPVESGGDVVMRFPSKRLDAPGPGRLEARFAGSAEVGRATASSVVQRTARVSLELARPLRPVDPSEGFDVHVAVGSVAGAVPGGVVEALVGADSVGSGPVVRGAARVVVAFDAPARGTVPLTLRYVPDAPWWIPGAPTAVALPVSGPSPWRRLPWVLAAMGIAAWVASAWRRPARPRSADGPGRGQSPTGRPSIDLIELGPPGSGWRGVVTDAHDGLAIEGARVSVLVPAFEGDGIAASALTGADGGFNVGPLPNGPSEGAVLEVAARLHASVRRPLPSPGYVTVSLVARRRALLDALVRWAEARGRAWAHRGDPTPGHVERVARRRGERGAARWARETERVVFGPGVVDEARDRAVRELEPAARDPDGGR